MDLIVRVSGEVTSSNLEEYKKDLFVQIDEIDTSLETEEDLVRAKKTIADLQTVEKAINDEMEAAINGTVAIRDVFETMKAISGKVNETWSKLNKDLTAEVKRIAAENKRNREKVVEKGIETAVNYIDSLVRSHTCLEVTMFSLNTAIISEAAKGKKKVETTQKAVDPIVEKCMDALEEKAAQLITNHSHLEGHPEHLFPDANTIIQKPEGELLAIIKGRVAEYNLEQERKERAEKEAVAEKAKMQVVSEKNPATLLNETFLPDEDQESLKKAYPSLETEKVRVGQVETPVLGEFVAPQAGQPHVALTIERFTLTVTLTSDVDKAKEIAGALDKAICHYPEVGPIKLTRVFD